MGTIKGRPTTIIITSAARNLKKIVLNFNIKIKCLNVRKKKILKLYYKFVREYFESSVGAIL